MRAVTIAAFLIWSGALLAQATSSTADRPTSEIGATPPNCAALILYRDGQLVSDWDLQLNKARAIEEGTRDLAAIRAELSKDGWWVTSTIPDIALAIKTFTDIVYGVIATVSPAGKVVDFSKQLLNVSYKRHEIAERVWNGLKRGKQATAMASEEFAGLTASLLLDNLGSVGKAASLVKNTAANLQLAEALPSEKERTRTVLAEQYARLDLQMAALESAAAQLKANMDAVNGVRDAIDAYCGKRKPPEVPALDDKLADLRARTAARINSAKISAGDRAAGVSASVPRDAGRDDSTLAGALAPELLNAAADLHEVRKGQTATDGAHGRGNCPRDTSALLTQLKDDELRKSPAQPYDDMIRRAGGIDPALAAVRGQIAAYEKSLADYQACSPNSSQCRKAVPLVEDALTLNRGILRDLECYKRSASSGR